MVLKAKDYWSRNLDTDGNGDCLGRRRLLDSPPKDLLATVAVPISHNTGKGLPSPWS
jgi:hypothetical protein